METTILTKTSSLGQSIWLDYISRKLLTDGGLKDWIDRGVTGVTTNPSIFEQAIAKTGDYDDEIAALAKGGRDASAIYEALTLQEVGAAADIMRPVYDAKNCGDGFVSLEVNPLLAADTSSTVSEGTRLFAALKRPNVMIKVPATIEGIEAIKELTAAGVNVNATLIFSAAQYSAVADAYVAGLSRLPHGVKAPASVASVFVSRVDSAVDPLLPQEMRGHIAIDNARMIYRRFHEIFSDSNPQWKALGPGARVQRPLWASTGTKNAAYSDVLYVESLIGADTVNTVPPKTLDAFMAHGKAAGTVEDDLPGAEARIKKLSALGVDLNWICSKLMKDGVEAFNNSFRSLMKSIEDKAAQQVR